MRSTLRDAVSAMCAAADAFPWTDRRAYGDWLAQTYYYVRHSTRLLAAAAARFPQGKEGDELHYRFAAHIGEEKRHELLALHDLQVLDFKLDAFEERQSTRAFYEPQYAKIDREGPLSLFGYILVLESLAAERGRQIAAQVQPVFGKGSATFVSVHAHDDPEHVDTALRFAEAITGPDAASIERNIRQSAFSYLALMRDVAGA